MFKKVLIANRGEIAVRIARTLQQMGVGVVAVYSEADHASPHVLAADEVYPLEGRTASETYLRGERIIEIATAAGAQAVHPGYGFLAENPDFAEACEREGLVFIGPSSHVIRAMGDKPAAKKAFAAAGVPVVPSAGEDGNASIKTLRKAAAQIGYPVLIKAAGGGGGKGMRIVRAESELPPAIEAAQREARAAFADGRIFIEKYLTRPRHVEVQILGDREGHVVHLLERECSIQRRHQKIVEESPSPALTAEVRTEICRAAVTAARAVGYRNAGTVEFLVDESGAFYFLEVNARLQVEHPVTEMIVGHDLVRLQLLIAAGEPLPFTQDKITPTGHAIEVRVYAEDPARQFLPATGVLERYVEPVGPFIRIDSGVQQGMEVSTHYDPMLAKLIAWGCSREEAMRRLTWALDHYVILGVTTNVPFLQALVRLPDFGAGRIHTQFLEEHAISPAAAEAPIEALMAAAICVHQYGRSGAGARETPLTTAQRGGPWQVQRVWRNV